MSTETKINDILDAISQEIENRESLAAQAMKDLEKMSLTSEEYKEANIGFGTDSFIAAYLRSIKSKIEEFGELKKIESYIRFHCHYQLTKGGLQDQTNFSVGQAILVGILESYINRFFN